MGIRDTLVIQLLRSIILLSFVSSAYSEEWPEMDAQVSVKVGSFKVNGVLASDRKAILEKLKDIKPNHVLICAEHQAAHVSLIEALDAIKEYEKEKRVFAD